MFAVIISGQRRNRRQWVDEMQGERGKKWVKKQKINYPEYCSCFSFCCFGVQLNVYNLQLDEQFGQFEHILFSHYLFAGSILCQDRNYSNTVFSLRNSSPRKQKPVLIWCFSVFVCRNSHMGDDLNWYEKRFRRKYGCFSNKEEINFPFQSSQGSTPLLWKWYPY